MRKMIGAGLALLCCQPLAAQAAVTVEVTGFYTGVSAFTASVTTPTLLSLVAPGTTLLGSLSVSRPVANITAEGTKNNEDGSPRRTTVSITDARTGATSSVIVDVACFQTESFVCSESKVSRPQLRGTRNGNTYTYQIYNYTDNGLQPGQAITLPAPLSVSASGVGSAQQVDTQSIGPGEDGAAFRYIANIDELQIYGLGELLVISPGVLAGRTNVSATVPGEYLRNQRLIPFDARLRISGQPDITPDPEPGTGEGAVPEPGSWALLIAGLGVLGATLRRRVAGPRTSPLHAGRF